MTITRKTDSKVARLKRTKPE